ncbi:MAG: hypothetical protein FJY85_05490 [Deltaproteobacteria bacterium]|nr:hypothetical protein [Deltaproteobacteria bacterium]
MKAAIKFCGGCDPAYDRVELFERMKAAAGGSIEWVRVEEQGHEAVLLVSGCLRACPEEELGHVTRLISLKHDGLSPESVVAQLLGKGQTDENNDKR